MTTLAERAKKLGLYEADLHQIFDFDSIRVNIYRQCYTSIAIYKFLDAILKSCFLREGLNKPSVENEQVEQF
jgi:hypothetical protein